MAEENRREARLIPTSGIKGAEEQERRATSALLAVLSAAREHGRSLLKPLGAPTGNISTYKKSPSCWGRRGSTQTGAQFRGPVWVRQGTRSLWNAQDGVAANPRDLMWPSPPTLASAWR